VTRRTSPTIEASGFTLLELLVAITVGSIVITAVYAVFTTALRTQRKAQQVFGPMRSARYAFEALADDVRNLDPFSKPADVQCSGKTCQFPILTPLGARLWVQYTGQDGRLVRRLANNTAHAAGTQPSGQGDFLCSNVARASFSLKSKQGLAAARSAPTAAPAPTAIGLQLVFGRGAQPRTVFDTLVMLEVAPSPEDAQ
jgi:prepilin-type N-terminal cleavage/methylation domain-containing protein